MPERAARHWSSLPVASSHLGDSYMNTTGRLQGAILSLRGWILSPSPSPEWQDAQRHHDLEVEGVGDGVCDTRQGEVAWAWQSHGHNYN